jgi:hypothetical protein
LAANPTTFQAQNGFAAFGQFTRNLSNKSQKIVLADAFGNIIDTVEYFDTTPWPTAADGNGSYLQLTSTSLDNNLAASWVASNVALETGEFSLNYGLITIYPNPGKYLLTIQSQINIDRLELFDVYGKVVKYFQVNSSEVQINVSDLSSGMYFVKVYTEYGIKTEKWIKD